jgi:hypothetical protein
MSITKLCVERDAQSPAVKPMSLTRSDPDQCSVPRSRRSRYLFDCASDASSLLHEYCEPPATGWAGVGSSVWTTVAYSVFVAHRLAHNFG